MGEWRSGMPVLCFRETTSRAILERPFLAQPGPIPTGEFGAGSRHRCYFLVAPGAVIQTIRQVLVCMLHGGKFLQGVSERGGHGKVRRVVGI